MSMCGPFDPNICADCRAHYKAQGYYRTQGPRRLEVGELTRQQRRARGIGRPKKRRRA